MVAAAQVLNPVLMGIVGGVGAALGELTGYLLGRTGRRVLRRAQRQEWQRRLARFTWLRRIMRRMGVLLFLVAATPFPFDVVGILAGTVRYPVWRFLLWVSLGKIIHTTIITVAAYYAVGWLYRLMEPPVIPAMID